MLIPKLSAVFIYTCNGKYSRKDIKRFIKFIRINRETGCWEWTGSLNGGGYGRFSICRSNKTKIYSTHRAAIEMAIGILIPDGMFSCHHCDNPKCVNVLACLFLGTQLENVKDMVNKGRNVCKKGEEHHFSKLTRVQVAEIRRLYAIGNISQRQLAKIFNITQTVIGKIINNELWYDDQYYPTKLIINHINQEIANKIRDLYITKKYSQRELANKFEISLTTINFVINNKRWK